MANRLKNYQSLLMPSKLAQFPLQIVVFPGEALNLHIFEPRYRQLIRDCESDGITFGVPTFMDNRLRSIGCEVRLTSVEKRYPGGELDVRTEGTRIFRILNFERQLDDKLYGGATVEFLEHDTAEDVRLNALILDRIRELFELMQVDKPLPEDVLSFSAYRVAHYVGFTLEQEYAFLSLLNAATRQQYMIEHLDEVMPVVREMNTMRKRAQLNGHFKHLAPPKI